MAITFTFHIDPTRIRVRDPHTGFHQEIKNLAIVGQKHGFLLALGEPEDKIRARIGSQRGGRAIETRSCSLFEADGAELPYELQAIQYFTRLLHRQSQQARPWAHFGNKLVDGFDYLMTIQGYEDFPAARRGALEGSLQAYLRIRRLVINGRALHIPMWRRNLDFWLRRLLAQVLPIVALGLGFLNMPARIAASPLTFLAYLMAITYLFYYGGRALWMLLSRLLVPPAYRLRMLQGTRDRLGRIDGWLAKVVWGEI